MPVYHMPYDVSRMKWNNLVVAQDFFVGGRGGGGFPSIIRTCDKNLC